MIKSRLRMIPALLAIWAISIIAMIVMWQIEPSLWTRESQYIPGYEIWLAGDYDTLIGKILYIFANWTECHGLMCWLAGVVMIAGGLIAHWYLRKNKSKDGIKMYPPSGPGGGYLGMIAAGFTGLIVANLLWGFRFDVTAGVTYLAVFIVCCAVPAGLTLTYGNNWKVWITAGVICGIIQYPFEEFSFWLASVVHIPPLVLFTTLVVLCTGIVCVELFKLCPWVKQYVKHPESRQITPYVQTNCAPRATSGWLFRRTLADWTEIMFFGNEWVSLATIAALVLSWWLNPFSVVYASPNVMPGMVFGSLLAGSLSLFIFYPKYEKNGFYNTFCTVSAFLLTFLYFGMNGTPAACTSLPLIIVCAVLMAFVAPLITNTCSGWLFSKLGKRYEGATLAVLGNAPSIGVAVLVCYLMTSGLIATGVFF